MTRVHGGASCWGPALQGTGFCSNPVCVSLRSFRWGQAQGGLIFPAASSSLWSEKAGNQGEQWIWYWQDPHLHPDSSFKEWRPAMGCPKSAPTSQGFGGCFVSAPGLVLPGVCGETLWVLSVSITGRFSPKPAQPDSTGTPGKGWIAPINKDDANTGIFLTDSSLPKAILGSLMQFLLSSPLIRAMNFPLPTAKLGHCWPGCSSPPGLCSQVWLCLGFIICPHMNQEYLL